MQGPTVRCELMEAAAFAIHLQRPRIVQIEHDQEVEREAGHGATLALYPRTQRRAQQPLRGVLGAYAYHVPYTYICAYTCQPVALQPTKLLYLFHSL